MNITGENLFTSTTGRNIILPKNDTKILIPCKVSRPDADVSLDKSEEVCKTNSWTL